MGDSLEKDDFTMSLSSSIPDTGAVFVLYWQSPPPPRVQILIPASVKCSIHDPFVASTDTLMLVILSVQTYTTSMPEEIVLFLTHGNCNFWIASAHSGRLKPRGSLWWALDKGDPHYSLFTCIQELVLTGRWECWRDIASVGRDVATSRSEWERPYRVHTTAVQYTRVITIQQSSQSLKIWSLRSVTWWESHFRYWRGAPARNRWHTRDVAHVQPWNNLSIEGNLTW